MAKQSHWQSLTNAVTPRFEEEEDEECVCEGVFWVISADLYVRFDMLIVRTMHIPFHTSDIY